MRFAVLILKLKRFRGNRTGTYISHAPVCKIYFATTKSVQLQVNDYRYWRFFQNCKPYRSQK